MGGKTPETCRAVNKRQDNKLENCCIWLVIYLNCTMTHGITNLKFKFNLGLCSFTSCKLFVECDSYMNIKKNLLLWQWLITRGPLYWQFNNVLPSTWCI